METRPETPPAPQEDTARQAAGKVQTFIVGKLLKWGLPTSGAGATLYFLLESEWLAAIIAFVVSFVVSLFTIFVDFTRRVSRRVLEKIKERRKGNFPAWEGIRIVRERFKA